MAIPDPDTLANIVKFTPIKSTAFLELLEADMNDADKVKAGFRTNSSFSFYIPGYIFGITFDEVRKALKEAGWAINELRQNYGYMPTNGMSDYRNADSTTVGVVGNLTFPWVSVNIYRTPS